MSDPDETASGVIARPAPPRRGKRPPPPQRPAPAERPQKPKPGAAPVPGPTDPRALARQLLTALARGKAFDFTRLSSSQLGEIEKALVVELNRQEIRKYGYKLRNLLRFTLAERNGLLASLPAAKFSIDNQGTQKKVDLKGLGTVQMGLDAKLGGKEAGDAFVLTFRGDTAGVHWLQFIWRRIVAHYPASTNSKAKEVPFQSRYTFGSKLPKPHDRSPRVVVYTVDPDWPSWSTDGLVAESPFYEGKNAVRREPDLLQLADSPGPNDSETRRLFDAPVPPSKCVSTFTAVAYLVKGSAVLYRAKLSRSWEITRLRGNMTSVGGKWAGSGEVATKLDAAHRKTLALQFPRWDYFPGDRIGPPVPRPAFQPLDPAHPEIVNWPDKSPLERLRAAANATNAKLIEDVDQDPQTDVLTIHDGVKRAGLCYFAPLRGKSTNLVAGETGYVDEAGTYHNPTLPHVESSGAQDRLRYEALPRVTMLLGEDAFQWGTAAAGGSMPNKRDKLYALGALRHEMLHAVHNRIALEWVLKWRDEMDKDGFLQWSQRNARNALEVLLLRTGLPSTTATEVLAYTEGFVTTLPFLGSYPGLPALQNKALWPAAIIELDGLLRKKNLLLSPPAGLASAMDKRLHEVICGGLQPQQRVNLAQWMDSLSSVDPRQASAGDQASAKQLYASFNSEKLFLLGIKKMAERC